MWKLRSSARPLQLFNGRPRIQTRSERPMSENVPPSLAGGPPASETGALWWQLLVGRLCKLGLCPSSQTYLLFSPHSLHLYALQRPRKLHFPVKISQAGNPRRLLFLSELSACAPCLALLTQTCTCTCITQRHGQSLEPQERLASHNTK